MTRRSPAEAVQHAVAALAAGGMVVVVDDVDRENEGDLIVGAELLTTEQIAFMVRHGTGIVCVPMSGHRADELRLPPMVVSTAVVMPMVSDTFRASSPLIPRGNMTTLATTFVLMAFQYVSP